LALAFLGTDDEDALVGVEQPDGAAFYVNLIDAIAGVATRRAVLPARARAALVKPQNFRTCATIAWSPRVASHCSSADGGGELLAFRAGQIEHEGPGTFGQRRVHVGIP
jgi:hypothetical protein